VPPWPRAGEWVGVRGQGSMHEGERVILDGFSSRPLTPDPSPARGEGSNGGRPGLVLAGIGCILALAFIAMGFVDLGRMLLAHSDPLLGVAQWWCLALVAAVAFAGVGAWWQLDRARAAHPAEAVNGARSVLRILVLFFLVTPFWSLFDQKASTWVLQGNRMT